MRARGAEGTLGNPFVLPGGAAGELYRPAVCRAHEMMVRLALRAPDAVSVERLAAREWRLADGTYGTLTVDDRYKREARPNLGAEIREAVAELVDRVRHERVLLLCSCVAGCGGTARGWRE